MIAQEIDWRGKPAEPAPIDEQALDPHFQSDVGFADAFAKAQAARKDVPGDENK